MGGITIFVWEEKDWGIRMGYVRSARKAGDVKYILEKRALWYREVDVFGWNLFVGDNLKNVKLRKGEIILE